MIVTALWQIVVAAYSAPLTRVHIDTDHMSNTPELVYVHDESYGGASLAIRGETFQYIWQLEHHSGFGVQLSGALGLSQQTLIDAGNIVVDGILYGGQVRIYQELFSVATSSRPHAFTVFANGRAVRTSGSNDEASAAQTSWGAGAGFMAEIALGAHVSLLPYAWFSPSLARHKRVQLAGEEAQVQNVGAKLTRPLRAGLDLWFYPSGLGSPDHFSASVLTSFIDTSGQSSQETAIVLGYTF